MHPRNILFVSHSSGLGGAERALVELVGDLRSAGIESVAWLPMPGPLAALLAAEGAGVVVSRYVGWAGRERPSWKRALATVSHLPAAVWALARSQRHAFDLVCTNTSTVFIGAVAARVLRLPHVWLVHEYGLEDHGLSFDLGHDRTWRWIGRHSIRVGVVSHALGAHAERWIPREKIRVLRQAGTVPARTSAGVVPPRPGVLSCAVVATLQPRKGQDELIRAAAILRDRGIDIEVDLLGEDEGGFASRLRRLAEDLGVATRVHLRGWVDNPAAWMERADVVICTSTSEAFGRAVVEAMRAGKLVVATAAGGIPELIEAGATGLLYRPGDPGALADALAWAWTHPEEARSIGAAARESVARRLPFGCLGESFLAALSD